MKRLYTFLTIILSSYTLFSQEIKSSREELTKLLCKNWEVNEVIVNGEMTENKLTTIIEFRIDNTFFEKPITDKSENGVWVYNKEKKCVDLIKKEKLVGTIKFINQEQFIYEPVLNEEAKKFTKSVELQFIALD
jgi:hypothetical protein